MKHKLNHVDIHSLARQMVLRIMDRLPSYLVEAGLPVKIWGVPRGGIPVAYYLAGTTDNQLKSVPVRFMMAPHPEKADVIVDDIIDSGVTRTKWTQHYPGCVFEALVDKTDASTSYKDAWVVFPWEASEGQEETIEDNVTRILQYVGEDPSRSGLAGTPTRVARAWEDWTSGYNKDPGEILKCFEDGAEGCDEMVVVQNLPFYSHCEHHLAPFFGTATIGYIPNNRIVGLSKLPRLLEIFSKRLQVQERLTNQVVDAINEHLKPVGAGCIIQARHLCMESRGISQQGHWTTTSAVRGAMKDQAETRAEFLSLKR